jgi:hypothetical protein
MMNQEDSVLPYLKALHKASLEQFSGCNADDPHPIGSAEDRSIQEEQFMMINNLGR